MSTATHRVLIRLVAVNNLLFGAVCVASGVYVLWAGAAAVSDLFGLKEHAAGLTQDAQVNQATDLAAKGISGVILALAGVLGGCAIAQGLPWVLTGVGLLLRRNWARVLALVLAVLLGLEGLAMLLGSSARPGQVVGAVFLAHAVLSFVALLGKGASLVFSGKGQVSEATPGEGATVTGSPSSASALAGSGRFAIGVLSAALLVSIIGLVILALRPVSFTLVPPSDAHGSTTWQLSPFSLVTASAWPDTSTAYRDRVAKFHDAASKGQVSRVVEMLQMGASANDKDEKGRTALMLASEKGHVTVVTLLLLAGAQVGERDDQGQTALMLAAEKGHASIVNLLLGDTPEATTLQALSGQLANVNPTLKEKDGTIKLPGLNLKIPTGGLVAKELSVVNAQDNEGRTACMRAVVNDHFNIALKLLDSGTDRTITDKRGNTALHLLAAQPQFEVWITPTGRFNAFWCVPGEFTVIGNPVRQFGSVSVANTEGMEPWMIAAAAGHLHVVQRMLLDADAIRAGRAAADDAQLEQLLSRADALARTCLAHRNSKGKTGLDLAREAGHKEVVAYLESLLNPKK
jgi:ankyrin repeat protein